MESQTRTRMKSTTYPDADRTRIVKCIAESGDALTVTPGQYYRVLPDKAEEHGMLRVIDNTGEDYLYAASSFENVDDLNRLQAELLVRLDAPTKATILQIANQRGVSMSALVREWIEERVDLPATAAR
ncbi:ribbon-helix-helix protein, CopG family [Caldilinea sp.]|uniref:ribbon-helix-helix protein, CopG family n=1 Tax=Caldilinea sp. TaxID=2293560 RepID=UPI002C622612|nr:ribbon-helix-helix protein, CopG family [Caldilinea sp.]HRA64460.1 ribbon-helix-helix protein, CopG family [Caldilinea sp.]